MITRTPVVVVVLLHISEGECDKTAQTLVTTPKASEGGDNKQAHNI